MKKLLLYLFFGAGLLVANQIVAQSGQLLLTITQNGEPITDTLDNGTVITFNTSTDDAEQENDAMDALYDDDIDAGWEGDPEKQNILTAGLRFQNVQLGNDIKIDSAFLILTSHEGKSTDDVAKITIVGEASDNSQTFTLDALISDRPQTETSVIWEVVEEWIMWEPYKSIDIKSVIQEIIDRAGWNSGNALTLILKGEDQGPSDVDNAREFESFENISDPEDGGDGQNHPERVPQLMIYYTSTSLVNTVGENKNLHIYPNPVSNGIVHIDLNSDRQAIVSIFDQTGRQVMVQYSTNSNKVILNVSDLPKGFYYVKAEQGDTYTQKLIIK